MKARSAGVRGAMRDEARHQTGESETKQWTRTSGSRSIQSELDDADEDEYEQGGGNGHVQRIAHSITLGEMRLRGEAPIVIT